jgi:gliding motility-associated lipoprotein GldK
VTNAQYKEFTNWVRDSLAAIDLGGEYITVKDGDTAINWKYATHINYSDPAIMAKLTNLLLDPSKSLSNRPQIDPHKLVYRMEGFNYQEAAKKENEGRSPKDFVYRQDVEVYPDTLVWMRDFGYANNEHMSIGYYASDKYKNYPVVGVSWVQANAYCDWFTKQRVYKEQRKRKMPNDGVCRLPTQAEWAYAASLNDNDADVKANKNDTAGNKTREDGLLGNKLFPEMVVRNKRGGYHIYDMAGNVSEWTNTSFYEGSVNFVNRFNPDIEWGNNDSKSKFKRRKVVCGGSWKDIPALTTTSNRFYEDMDNAHSYIGFRVVLNFPD